MAAAVAAASSSAAHPSLPASSSHSAAFLAHPLARDMEVLCASATNAPHCAAASLVLNMLGLPSRPGVTIDHTNSRQWFLFFCVDKNSQSGAVSLATSTLARLARAQSTVSSSASLSNVALDAHGGECRLFPRRTTSALTWEMCRHGCLDSLVQCALFNERWLPSSSSSHWMFPGGAASASQSASSSSSSSKSLNSRREAAAAVDAIQAGDAVTMRINAACTAHEHGKLSAEVGASPQLRITIDLVARAARMLPLRAADVQPAKSTSKKSGAPQSSGNASGRGIGAAAAVAAAAAGNKSAVAGGSSSPIPNDACEPLLCFALPALSPVLLIRAPLSAQAARELTVVERSNSARFLHAHSGGASVGLGVSSSALSVSTSSPALALGVSGIARAPADVIVAPLPLVHVGDAVEAVRTALLLRREYSLRDTLVTPRQLQGGYTAATHGLQAERIAAHGLQAGLPSSSVGAGGNGSSTLYARVHAVDSSGRGPRSTLLAALAAGSASSDLDNDFDRGSGGSGGSGDGANSRYGPSYSVPLSALIRGIVPLRHATKVRQEVIEATVLHTITTRCRLAVDFNKAADRLTALMSAIGVQQAHVPSIAKLNARASSSVAVAVSVFSATSTANSPGVDSDGMVPLLATRIATQSPFATVSASACVPQQFMHTFSNQQLSSPSSRVLTCSSSSSSSVKDASSSAALAAAMSAAFASAGSVRQQQEQQQIVTFATGIAAQSGPVSFITGTAAAVKARVNTAPGGLTHVAADDARIISTSLALVVGSSVSSSGDGGVRVAGGGDHMLGVKSKAPRSGAPAVLKSTLPGTTGLGVQKFKPMLPNPARAYANTSSSSTVVFHNCASSSSASSLSKSTAAAGPVQVRLALAGNATSLNGRGLSTAAAATSSVSTFSSVVPQGSMQQQQQQQNPLQTTSLQSLQQQSKQLQGKVGPLSLSSSAIRPSAGGGGVVAVTTTLTTPAAGPRRAFAASAAAALDDDDDDDFNLDTTTDEDDDPVPGVATATKLTVSSGTAAGATTGITPSAFTAPSGTLIAPLGVPTLTTGVPKSSTVATASAAASTSTTSSAGSGAGSVRGGVTAAAIARGVKPTEQLAVKPSARGVKPTEQLAVKPSARGVKPTEQLAMKPSAGGAKLTGKQSAAVSVKVPATVKTITAAVATATASSYNCNKNSVIAPRAIPVSSSASAAPPIALFNPAAGYAADDDDDDDDFNLDTTDEEEDPPAPAPAPAARKIGASTSATATVSAGGGSKGVGTASASAATGVKGAGVPVRKAAPTTDPFPFVRVTPFTEWLQRGRRQMPTPACMHDAGASEADRDRALDFDEYAAHAASSAAAVSTVRGSITSNSDSSNSAAVSTIGTTSSSSCSSGNSGSSVLTADDVDLNKIRFLSFFETLDLLSWVPLDLAHSTISSSEGGGGGLGSASCASVIAELFSSRFGRYDEEASISVPDSESNASSSSGIHCTADATTADNSFALPFPDQQQHQQQLDGPPHPSSASTSTTTTAPQSIVAATAAAAGPPHPSSTSTSQSSWWGGSSSSRGRWQPPSHAPPRQVTFRADNAADLADARAWRAAQEGSSLSTGSAGGGRLDDADASIAREAAAAVKDSLAMEARKGVLERKAARAAAGTSAATKKKAAAAAAAKASSSSSSSSSSSAACKKVTSTGHIGDSEDDSDDGEGAAVAAVHGDEDFDDAINCSSSGVKSAGAKRSRESDSAANGGQPSAKKAATAPTAAVVAEDPAVFIAIVVSCGTDEAALKKRCEIKHLKAWCKSKKLPVGGNKTQLIERVLGALSRK